MLIMSTKVFPRQTNFTIDREDWGKATLSVGAVAETRVILADLIINSEDVLGPDVSFAHIVALRIVPTPDLAKKVENMPLPPQTPVPLTSDAGYEKVEVSRVDKTTESIYRFEGYVLSLKLEIQSVARNMCFRLPSGAPLYNVRWNVTPNIKKA